MTTNADADNVSDGSYDASALTVLRGLDAVRKRPGMYIGGTGQAGLNHMLWEIVDNSVDEAAAGHCSTIDIILHDDGSAEVHDNGRGIPVDAEKSTGRSGLELVFTELHAGGKFGGGGYAASGGLHGVGASVVNALSARLDAEVDRGGKTWSIQFHQGTPGRHADGKAAPSPTAKFTEADGVHEIGKVAKARTGTRVRFWPDFQIFEKGAVFDLDAVLERSRQIAFLVPGVTIRVTDLRSDPAVKEEFCFTQGIVDFADFLTKGEKVSDVLHIQGEAPYVETVPVLVDGELITQDVERTLGVDVAVRWSAGWEPELRSFVNTITTPKGGTHVTGFERAMTKVLNEALREAKVLRDKDDNVIKDDVLEGSVAIVKVTIVEPQFEGQTKEVLGTPAAQTIVNQVVTDQLRAWFARNAKKPAGKAVLQKVHNAAKARLAARLQRETIRRKNALESSSMPAKLADCRVHDLERSELFLIEGDSAAGSAKGARDSEFQALLPLRGKILNVAKANTKQVLDNAECAAIFTAMGGGWGKNFDVTSIRYGRVIIMCDADVDGSHIRTLLLTLFYHYMRPIIEEGRVYAAMPPLFKVVVSGNREIHYAYTDDEKEKILAMLAKQGKKVKELQRYKGLGEMSADQLAETTVDPGSRSLRRVNLSDAEAAARMFDVLMGDQVEPRRNFIIENAGLVSADSLDI